MINNNYLHASQEMNHQNKFKKKYIFVKKNIVFDNDRKHREKKKTTLIITEQT